MIAIASPEASRHPLELPIHSLAALVKQRGAERDLAELQRDTYRTMLSLALTQLHDAHVRTRRQRRTIYQLCAQRRAQGRSTRGGY